MKKYLVSFALLSAFAAFLTLGFHSSAQDVFSVQDDQQAEATDRVAASTTLVLSQVSGGNGYYNNDWVEIKNVSASPQSLNGLTLLYGSATGNFGGGSFALPNATLVPGQYYLVQLNSAAPGTTPLPVTPDASTTNISMSGTSGKVGIVAAGGIPGSACGATATPCTPTQLEAFIDWVAWGAAGNGTANSGEGGNPSVNNGVAITATQGMARKTDGCTDTDNNNLDFDLYNNPPVFPIPSPRNTSTAPAPCGGGSGELQGIGSASPSLLLPGATTLLRVTVVPASSPPSTGITVRTDLTSLGGSATQSFFDNGTNGDTTAGDNVFSYSMQIPVGTASGSRTLPVNIADAELRTATTSISLTVTTTTPHTASEHQVLGNPSDAQTEPIGYPNDYLMEKNQYVLSYSRDRGTPNWVAWHLDSSWLGNVERQDDYREDTTLPNLAGWYRVQGSDYTGSPQGEGFDRGHMCPSGDRVNTIADNSATFLMTNMIPQAPVNNQLVWADLEDYCRGLVDAGNELYIFTGGAGVGGTGLQGLRNTIVGGRVTVPAQVWKVIVVLPVGSDDAQRVNNFTRVISVLMPNSQSVSRPWTQYRTNVGKIEQVTGLNFLSKVRPQIRVRLKKRVDKQ
ncbi:MAG: DNA/RNA non-specific endonuclease [Chloracidobacterium sp.]|nr:DNA/RNA non-specific endonuclease [Chloracidobacterium sp.]